MAKIVIDINDKDYKLFMELMSGNLWRNNYQNIIGKCLDAIKHGKVLPEDYGRIGDLDKLIKRITNLPKCPNGHSKMYDEAMIINIINSESAIIEAEREEYVNFADDLLPIIDEVESEGK